MNRRDIRDIEADYAAERARKRKAARETSRADVPERTDADKPPETAVPAKPRRQPKPKADG